MHIVNRNGTYMELSGNPCLGCISLFCSKCPCLEERRLRSDEALESSVARRSSRKGSYAYGQGHLMLAQRSGSRWVSAE